MIRIQSFDLSTPQFFGATSTLDGSARLLLLPIDIDTEQLESNVLTEMRLRAQLEKALVEARYILPISTMKAGLQFFLGEWIDFVASNKQGSRRIGIHVMAATDGLDEAFVRRLIDKAGDLELLIIVSPSVSRASQAPHFAGARLPTVEYMGGGDGSSADFVARRLHDELSDPIIVRPLRPLRFLSNRAK